MQAVCPRPLQISELAEKIGWIRQLLVIVSGSRRVATSSRACHPRRQPGSLCIGLMGCVVIPQLYKHRQAHQSSVKLTGQVNNHRSTGSGMARNVLVGWILLGCKLHVLSRSVGVQHAQVPLHTVSKSTHAVVVIWSAGLALQSGVPVLKELLFWELVWR